MKEETKKKISATLKAKGRGNPHPTIICEFCKKPKEVPYNQRHRKYCSRSCSSFVNGKIGGSIGGRISAANQNRRSLNEIKFSELCLSTFNNVLCNVKMFNGWDADVILLDYKIAVLWNGIWHHKKVNKKHSLEQVKKRDEIKSSEINKCKYIVYVIDDFGKANEAFVLSEFDKLKQFIAGG